MGRARETGGQDGWRDKLHAVFFELAKVNEEFERRWSQLQIECGQQLEAAGSDVSPDVRKEIVTRFTKERDRLETWVEEKLVGINKRFTPIPYNPVAYGYFTLDPSTSDSQGLREYIHFHRHGESLEVTEAKDAGEDIKAWDKIARTEKDLRILAFGKGPIAPFKEDTIQRQLLQLVICYERERLTAEELAECFDNYCACGRENHEADSLRKMRDRFEAELRRR
jgi:hypothetical protein